MAEALTFIALGSAVKMQDDESDSIYVIISRAFMQTPDGQILAGYQAVTYPRGYGENFRIHVIRSNEISEILSQGYSDEQEERFAEERLAELEERIKNLPLQQATDSEDQTLLESEANGNILTNEEQLAQDPFYKFQKRGGQKE